MRSHVKTKDSSALRHSYVKAHDTEGNGECNKEEDEAAHEDDHYVVYQQDELWLNWCVSLLLWEIFIQHPGLVNDIDRSDNEIDSQRYHGKDWDSNVHILNPDLWYATKQPTIIET